VAADGGVGREFLGAEDHVVGHGTAHAQPRQVSEAVAALCEAEEITPNRSAATTWSGCSSPTCSPCKTPANDLRDLAGRLTTRN
jgi:hypothetical protein